MKKKQVRIGIIGCGAISAYHIDALRLIPQAKLMVFCDIVRERAEEKAQGFADVCTNWHEVVSRDDIDLVFILTPNDCHCEMVVEAAKFGKDIFVQKPMARNVEEGELMIRAARESGVRLFQSFMHRYFEESLWTKNFLAQGGLGQVYLCRIRNSLPGSDYSTWQYDSCRCGAGGAILDVGVHGIDLVQHLIGEIEEVVSATKGQKIPQRTICGELIYPNNEDWALAQYRLKNGAMVTHEISWVQKWHCNRFVMEIHGEKGSIYLRTGYGPLAVASSDLSENGAMVMPNLPVKAFGYQQHVEVIDCILNDKEPICSGEDGLSALKIVRNILNKAR